VPAELAVHRLALSADGRALVYSYETQGERHGITRLLEDLFRLGIRLRDIDSTQSSLEDIFVDLVRKDP
jgi:ABC-2 type transport system ATP-binding protein